MSIGSSIIATFADRRRRVIADFFGLSWVITIWAIWLLWDHVGGTHLVRNPDGDFHRVVR